MKHINWKSLLIAVPAFLLGLALAFGVPAIGQNQAQAEKPPVGLEQAEELTQLANEAMRNGNYKDAIHALHSAVFILEEGLGLHMPNPGMMPGMMPGMGGGMGPVTMPMMPPGGNVPPSQHGGLAPSGGS